MAKQPQMPDNFYRDCSMFNKSPSFQYLMDIMRAEAINEFAFAAPDETAKLQAANVKHCTINEVESAVSNAAKKWDDH